MTNSALTRTYRITRMFLHLLTGLAASSLVFPFVGRNSRLEIFRRWSRALLEILAVRVSVHGDAPIERHGPTMLLSNHVSWLDIFVIASAVPSRFVAKSEIRRWPVVGWLIARQGTLFLERARRHDTARINNSVNDALQKGYCVAVFPEGTTTDGTDVLPFHGSLLQPIVDAGGHVQPVAIRYRRPTGEHNAAPAYVGETSFATSFWRVTGERSLVVEVHFAPPLPARARHRRELSRAAEAAIRTALASPAGGWEPGTRGDPRA